jgi:hypothetical protein
MLVVLTGLLACASAGRTATWEREGTSASSEGARPGADVEALSAEAEALWAQRDDREKLEQAIAKWEEVVAADPTNARALTRLARAHYFLADGFIALEEDAQDEEFEVYKKGVDYGELALIALEPGFEADMKAGKSFEEAISKISENGIEAAYWYCTNLGRFASKQGLSERLYYKDKLKTAMERILELDPEFYYGAADRYFGAFYSLLPGIAGRDTDRSAEHFEKSLSIAPEYLGTRVVKAQFLAPALDDVDMYREELQTVLDAPDTDNPDIAPENRAAKRTAKKMLGEIDDIF